MKSVWTAPTEDTCVDTTARKRGRNLSLYLLGALVTLLLAACGTNSMPLAGIPPVEDGDGNVTLHYTPTDAQVFVFEEGLETSGVGSRSPVVENGVAVLAYDLKPGRYLVRISKPGFFPFQKTIEIEDADTSLEEEVLLEPDPSYQQEPIDGDPGAGNGGAVVTPAQFSLRGNPSFDVSSLDDEQRVWYERVWAAVNAPNKLPEIDRLAESGDEYEFARLVYQYNRSLLMALRVTGDLRFLDEVDEKAQAMRASLSDSWCGGETSYKLYDFYGNRTAYGKDGFQNFQRKIGGAHYCKDTADLEEALMHGQVAMLAYAYHVNRDLPSPSGVDYGERADFWQDYLVNEYEPKWRERSGKQFPDMEFLNVKFCHTQAQYTLYFYYLGSMLADQGDPTASAYLDQARKMTDQYFEVKPISGKQSGGFVDVSTPFGPGVVWAFGAPYEKGSPKEEACPTTYARLVVEAALELHLEGFDRWGDEAIMEKLGNTIAHFVMDTYPVGGSDAPLAKDVTGGRGAGGIDPTDYRDRLTIGQAAITSFGSLAAWHDSGKISDFTQQVYERVEDDVNRPRAVFIPASMLFAVSAR